MEMNLNVAISDEPVFEQSTTIYVFFLTYIAFSNTLSRSNDDSLARTLDDNIHYTTLHTLFTYPIIY